MDEIDHTDHRHAASIETTLDFLNTHELDGSGRPVEHIATLEDATAWLVEHGLLYPEESRPLDRLDAPRKASLLAHIRATRTALREVVESLVAGRPASASAVATVNELLSRRTVVELVSANGALVAATATSATRSRTRWRGSPIHSPSPWPRARRSGSGSARTTGADGSSRTRHQPLVDAGAAWPAAATGPRRPAIAPDSVVSCRRCRSTRDLPGTSTRRPGEDLMPGHPARSVPSAVRGGAVSRR